MDEKQKFIFQIEIVERAYCPETCKEDYGSKDAYNSDFPSYVYASNHINQLFKDAYMWCNHMMSSIMSRHKTPIETWSQTDQDVYHGFERRMEYWDKLMGEYKCVGTEEQNERK